VSYPIRIRMIYIIFAALSCAGLAGAQTHFVLTDSSFGNNMNIFIIAPVTPTINGMPMESGDEIGVFDSLGQCFGHCKWKSNASASITVWGYESVSSAKGFQPGATFHFRIWDSSTSKEAPAKATYDITTPPFIDTTYKSNGLCKLASLTGTYSAVRGSTPALHTGYSFSLHGGELVYTLNRSIQVQIALFDLRGRSVFSINRTDRQGVHQVSLRNCNLPGGCYIARFAAGAEFHELPVVIGK
jgi:hypothetical protein